MRAHDTQAGDMAVLHPVRRLLLHLGQDVADDLGVVISRLGRARNVDGHIGQLRPRQRVVQVVLEEVVLGKVLDVGVLDQRDVGGAEDADIHFGGCMGLWWVKGLVVGLRGGGGLVGDDLVIASTWEGLYGEELDWLARAMSTVV